ncbi:hypothetical protein VTI74DRAFT_9351 [Chaetomium olivicolor]
MSSGNLSPRPSAGADYSALLEALNPLLVTNGGRWKLAAEGEAIEREFKFKTFAKTWDFMTAVALQCKIKNHHPEWSNVFNTTFIRWTTHHPKGLSQLDVDLAATCDKLAKDFGEVVPEGQPQPQQQQQQQLQQQQQGQEQSTQKETTMCGLVSRAAGSAGDCCVPKNAKK